MSDYRPVLTRPIYCRRDIEQAERQRHNGAERHNHAENVTQHRGSLRTPRQHNSSPARPRCNLIEINDGVRFCRRGHRVNCRTQPVFMWCRMLEVGAHHACWLLLQALFIIASVLTAASTTATKAITRGVFIVTSRPRSL